MSDPSTRLASSLGVLWDKFRDGMFQRVDTLDEAARALQAGSPSGELRRAAEREAHKLAGAVGTFGFAGASRLAREAEHMLEGTRPLLPADALRLAEIAAALRVELEHSPAVPPEAASPVPADRPLLLVVSRDAGFAEQVAMEAEARGMAARILHPARGGEIAAPTGGARVAAVDLAGSPDEEELRVLRALERSGAEVMVLSSGGGGLAVRLEAARLGARTFLQRPAPPPRVVEAALALLRPAAAPAERHVLALDDDPFVLAALRALLEARAIRVTPLGDPRLFWETLESERPELLILDYEMPHASGPELCRVVRGDPRWRTLPILLLTGHTDAASIQRIFAAGADDFVAKPFVGPELLTRIDNALERARPAAGE